MKFIVSVKDSSGKELHAPSFNKREEAEEHAALCMDRKQFPQFPLKKVIIKPEVATVIPGVEAVLDKDGVILKDAIPEIKIVQEAEVFEMVPDYTVEILDKSAEFEAEKVKEDAKKLKKELASESLKSFDITKIKDADTRQAIKFILDKIEGL